jgi:hypothetical protein
MAGFLLTRAVDRQNQIFIFVNARRIQFIDNATTKGNEMFNVKNLRTGRLLKDACSRQIIMYETRDAAEKAAHSMNRFAAVDGKRDRYVAIPV